MNTKIKEKLVNKYRGTKTHFKYTIKTSLKKILSSEWEVSITELEQNRTDTSHQRASPKDQREQISHQRSYAEGSTNRAGRVAVTPG